MPVSASATEMTGRSTGPKDAFVISYVIASSAGPPSSATTASDTSTSTLPGCQRASYGRSRAARVASLTFAWTRAAAPSRWSTFTSPATCIALTSKGSAMSRCV